MSRLCLNLHRALLEKMRIKNLHFNHGICLAPMAGVTDSAFRVIARKAGCELVFTEMVSAEGLVRKARKTRKYMEIHVDERPAGVQIFGAAPNVLAAAAQIAEDSGADLVDINMGCPVKKVLKAGAGSALMKDPLRVASIIKAVRNTISVPLTIKMRAGWRGAVNCLELGRIAESEGADAVILHPRTVEQSFGGRSDWSLISEMKSCLNIPVIGNGDIRSAEDACRMFQTTYCDGVMAGRGVMGNPWLFRSIRRKLENPESECLPPTQGEKKETAIMHLRYAVSIFGEQVGIKQFRNHLSWYARGGRGAVMLRTAISSIHDVPEMEKIINNFFLEQEKEAISLLKAAGISANL